MGTARMFNLGPAKSLSFHTWSVDDGFLRLQATNLGADSAALAPAPVLDNIVSIKAQYGFDTRAGVAFAPGDGVVIKEWSSSMINADNAGVTGDAGDYQRITALRIAVVARSKVPERPQPGQACVAQVPDPRWIFTAKEPSTAPLAKVMVDLTVPGDTVDWKCYRYRTFESVIPLRNSAWRP
jgi:type IV pilus assembly protein PilW